MIYPQPCLLPAGDSAILVEFADEIDDAVNDRVHALAQRLRDQSRPEILDLIPAYSSLLVCYDSTKIQYATLANFLQTILHSSQVDISSSPRLVEIPVTYGDKFGPDLEFVARWSGLSKAQVIELHVSIVYRVYFIGFTPGFAYLGRVPSQIAAPRLETPRARVPAGSIGIAGGQTGIYPMETPGGWRLIGRTTQTLFDPKNDSPTLLRPGDRVKFVSV